ncbi:MAG: glycyl-radical enzyme activating protein [Erysipelotrichaceae bacterium]|nr:glycyl-radical enzyme activating protein [Erysipelotrichaceae bacterium]
MIKVSNIERFATHDGPGIRTTVFLKGCPLHCPWCANPETWRLEPVLMHDEKKCVRCHSCQTVCPEGAIDFNPAFVLYSKKCTICGRCVEVCIPEALSVNGKDMTAEEIISEISKDDDYYRNSNGGVTLSGGEPLFQYERVLDLLKNLKEKGYHTALETTGMYSSEKLKQAEKYVDLFLFDFKHVDAGKLKEVTGGDFEVITGNLEYLLKTCQEKVIVRTPVIPDFNSDVIKEIINWAAERKAPEINLLPYHSLGKNKWNDLGRTYSYEKYPMMDKSELSEYAVFGESLGIKVRIGG